MGIGKLGPRWAETSQEPGHVRSRSDAVTGGASLKRALGVFPFAQPRLGPCSVSSDVLTVATLPRGTGRKHGWGFGGARWRARSLRYGGVWEVATSRTSRIQSAVAAATMRRREERTRVGQPVADIRHG